MLRTPMIMTTCLLWPLHLWAGAHPAGRSNDAATLLAWLESLPDRSENRLLSGQHVGFGEGVPDGYHKFVVELHTQVDKWVALVGADYGYGPQWEISQGRWDLSIPNQTLINHWNNGGLVTLSWHVPNPWTGKSAWDNSTANLTELVDPNSAVYPAWKTELDIIAGALAELRDAGVVVLFRPFHEMNGAWFWWGILAHPNDPEPYKEMWRHVHDYFTNEKGLDNLLWVYSVADPSLNNTEVADYDYPGDAYVDLVGENYYSQDLALPGYEILTALGKPYCLSEFGPNDATPQGSFDYARLPENIRNAHPQAVYWYSWGDSQQGDALRSIVSNQNAAGLFDDPWVMDATEVDWRLFTSVCGDGMAELPAEFGLRQNYPNPFNSKTTITYEVPEKTRVTLEIYDIVGREIRTIVSAEQEPGECAVVWDGRDDAGHMVASGVYFYQMRLQDRRVLTRKLLFLK